MSRLLVPLSFILIAAAPGCDGPPPADPEPLPPVEAAPPDHEPIPPFAPEELAAKEAAARALPEGLLEELIATRGSDDPVEVPHELSDEEKLKLGLRQDHSEYPWAEEVFGDNNEAAAPDAEPPSDNAILDLLEPDDDDPSTPDLGE